MTPAKTVLCRALGALMALFLVGFQPAAAADIDGFRSARFGMKKALVRQAIAADFKLGGKKIIEGKNLSEKTTLLIARVDNLLPGSGTSQINYTLGYKTKGLIQVDISFGKPLDKKVSSKELLAIGKILQQTLLARGFDKGKVVMNKATARPGLILLFRGTDAKGRTVALLGSFTLKKIKGKPKKFVLKSLNALRLSYILNTKKPDIFRIKKGDF